MPNWLCCRHLSGFEWAVHSHGRLRWAPCIHPGGRTRQTDLQQHVTRQQCLKLGSRHGMPGSCRCTRDGDWRLVRNGSLLAFSADVRAARPENIQGPWRSRLIFDVRLTIAVHYVAFAVLGPGSAKAWLTEAWSTLHKPP